MSGTTNSIAYLMLLVFLQTEVGHFFGGVQDYQPFFSYDDKDCPQHDIGGTVHQVSAQVCEQDCRNHFACVAFVVDTSGHCWLKSQCKQLTPAANRTVTTKIPIQWPDEENTDNSTAETNTTQSTNTHHPPTTTSPPTYRPPTYRPPTYRPPTYRPPTYPTEPPKKKSSNWIFILVGAVIGAIVCAIVISKYVECDEGRPMSRTESPETSLANMSFNYSGENNPYVVPTAPPPAIDVVPQTAPPAYEDAIHNPPAYEDAIHNPIYHVPNVSTEKLTLDSIS